MTPLADSLIKDIRATGPITLADYMSACLLHPTHGYYATRDPLGAAGDFTTAPEISQMFGELMGLCLAQTWLDQGAPPAFALAEPGPGRGTLMADVLRATARVPGFHDALSVHLVEASGPLKAVQAETLRGWQPVWHDHLDDLPDDRPLYLIANEFFDALPVRQFRRDGALWAEHMIGVDEGGALQSGWSPPKAVPELDARLDDTADGDVVELSPQTGPMAQAIGRRIAEHGGAAVICDYGDWGTLGDTVQAVRGHERVDVLDQPGQSDLSAHVDFEQISRAATCRHSRLATQGMFLERLGITARAQALAQGLSGDALDSHVAAHRRLTHPEEMGTLFKVMALYPDGAAPPPGLSE